MLSIEEAIKHCEEVAKGQDYLAKRCDDASGYTRSHNEAIRTEEAKKHCECASEHRQLAEWLTKLKAYEESWEELFSTVYEIKANAESEDIQNIAKFLVNYMLILEKRIKEVKADADDTSMD